MPTTQENINTMSAIRDRSQNPEIVAMAAAIIDALQTSGDSPTFANVTVTGDVTIGNDLSVTRNSTVGGTEQVTGAAIFKNTVQLAQGTYTNPSLTFEGDTDTGLYAVAANHLGLVLNGTRILDFTESNIGVETAIEMHNPAVFDSGLLITGGTVTQSPLITSSVILNKPTGVITTVATTLAALTTTTFTVTNIYINANSNVVAYIENYSGTYGTNGIPKIDVSNVTGGSFDIKITNVAPVNALNGILKIGFTVTA
jgi:hypothetical protein